MAFRQVYIKIYLLEISLFRTLSAPSRTRPAIGYFKELLFRHGHAGHAFQIRAAQVAHDRKRDQELGDLPLRGPCQACGLGVRGEREQCPLRVVAQDIEASAAWWRMPRLSTGVRWGAGWMIACHRGDHIA